MGVGSAEVQRLAGWGRPTGLPKAGGRMRARPTASICRLSSPTSCGIHSRSSSRLGAAASTLASETRSCSVLLAKGMEGTTMEGNKSNRLNNCLLLPILQGGQRTQTQCRLRSQRGSAAAVTAGSQKARQPGWVGGWVASAVAGWPACWLGGGGVPVPSAAMVGRCALCAFVWCACGVCGLGRGGAGRSRRRGKGREVVGGAAWGGEAKARRLPYVRHAWPHTHAALWPRSCAAHARH